MSSSFFFFNDTAPTEIYPLSLHDALPISPPASLQTPQALIPWMPCASDRALSDQIRPQEERVHARVQEVRSEEHTSELQSQSNLVCRLLLEKKKNRPYLKTTGI